MSDRLIKHFSHIVKLQVMTMKTGEEVSDKDVDEEEEEEEDEDEEEMEQKISSRPVTRGNVGPRRRGGLIESINEEATPSKPSVGTYYIIGAGGVCLIVVVVDDMILVVVVVINFKKNIFSHYKTISVCADRLARTDRFYVGGSKGVHRIHCHS